MRKRKSETQGEATVKEEAREKQTEKTAVILERIEEKISVQNIIDYAQKNPALFIALCTAAISILGTILQSWYYFFWQGYYAYFQISITDIDLSSKQQFSWSLWTCISLGAAWLFFNILGYLLHENKRFKWLFIVTVFIAPVVPYLWYGGRLSEIPAFLANQGGLIKTIGLLLLLGVVVSLWIYLFVILVIWYNCPPKGTKGRNKQPRASKKGGRLFSVAVILIIICIPPLLWNCVGQWSAADKRTFPTTAGQYLKTQVENLSVPFDSDTYVILYAQSERCVVAPYTLDENNQATIYTSYQILVDREKLPTITRTFSRVEVVEEEIDGTAKAVA